MGSQAILPRAISCEKSSHLHFEEEGYKGERKVERKAVMCCGIKRNSDYVSQIWGAEGREEGVDLIF